MLVQRGSVATCTILGNGGSEGARPWLRRTRYSTLAPDDPSREAGGPASFVDPAAAKAWLVTPAVVC